MKTRGWQRQTFIKTEALKVEHIERYEADSDRLEAFSIKGETEAEVTDTDLYKGWVGIKRQAQRQKQTYRGSSEKYRVRRRHSETYNSTLGWQRQTICQTYVKSKDRSISRQKITEADKKSLTDRNIYKDESSQRQTETERKRVTETEVYRRWDMDTSTEQSLGWRVSDPIILFFLWLV